MVSYKQIQLVCIMYIVAWMVSPPLAYGQVYRLLAILAAFIWAVLQIIMKKNNNRDGKMKLLRQRYLLCAVIYSVAVLGVNILFNNMSPISAFYNDITTYILLFVGYTAITYCFHRRYDELKTIFWFTIILVVLFSITSIMRDEKYYLMTRSAGSETDEAYIEMTKEAAAHGIGGFGFFAFTAVFAPIVLWCSYAYNGLKKVALLIAFIIIEFGVFSAGFTLALLISVVGISLCLFYNIKSIYGKITVILITILSAIFWDTISIYIYKALQSMAAGTMYANKVEDIFSFLIGGESVGTFASREERYLYSLQSIFKYPILGSCLWADKIAIGYHSSILDPFAAYGWIVGGAWMYVIAIVPYKMASISKIKGIKNTIVASLFLTALFNRTTMIMGMFFLIVPAIASIYYARKDSSSS